MVGSDDETARALDRQAEAVSAHAESVKASAGEVRRSAQAQETSADRRTELAADRTVLASERTYAAWVRTGMAALASGVGARALLQKAIPDWLAILASVVLILFAAFCFVAGVWRELKPGAPPPHPDTKRLPRLLLLTVNGFLVIVALAAVIGVVSTVPGRSIGG